MNKQENDQLKHSLRQLTDATLQHKDQEAEELIKDAITRQPGIAYFLVRRRLLQNRTLQVSQAKIGELQHRLQKRGSPKASSIFCPMPPVQRQAVAKPVRWQAHTTRIQRRPA